VISDQEHGAAITRRDIVARKSIDRPAFDVIGRPIAVNDWVSYLVRGRHDIGVGKILRITPKMISVSWKDTDRGYSVYEDDITLLPPEDVMMWLLKK
jgi:hypothetical protein